MAETVVSSMNYELNDDISSIEPPDFVIRESPFDVVIWFNKEIENYSVDVAIDDNDVDVDFMTLTEYDQQQYWKYHEYDPAFHKGITNTSNPTVYDTFWKLEFKHRLTSSPLVEFTVNYDIVDGASAQRYVFMLNVDRYVQVSPRFE